jgi:tetratricopeptide (TPR) repeat protein
MRAGVRFESSSSSAAPPPISWRAEKKACIGTISVTCGEHIDIEPTIYEKFCDGQRVAPRHICVDLDGKETYDVFYRNDVASILVDLREKVPARRDPLVVVRGDRTIVERAESRALADRKAVEAAYRNGDEAMRRALLEKTIEQGDAASLDLLRLALFGYDAEASKMARQALAKTGQADATDLIVDALRVPMEAAEREALLATLGRLGENSPRARWLSAVHRGLADGDTTVDVGRWSSATSGEREAAEARDWFEMEAARGAQADVVQAKPDDPAACLDLAETSLKLAFKASRSAAVSRTMARLFARQMFEEAIACAERATELGAKDWRAPALQAIAAYYDDRKEVGYAKAEQAVPLIPPGDASWNAMATLTIFAESRWTAIKSAVRKDAWSPEVSQWLRDLDATYSILLKHPLATDSQVVWHHDFLEWFGANHRATNILQRGLERFPESAALHERLRKRVLNDRGEEALEALYERMLKEKPSPNLEWFTGYALVVAAEAQRRVFEPDRARATYGRAIAHFEKAIEGNPDARDSADHQIALALASRARLAYERGDDAGAFEDILAALERRPASTGTKDGLSISAADTISLLRPRLEENKHDDLVAKLDGALKRVDPELLVTEDQ